MSDPDATADGEAAATPSLDHAGPTGADGWAPPTLDGGWAPAPSGPTGAAGAPGAPGGGARGPEGARRIWPWIVRRGRPPSSSWRRMDRRPGRGRLLRAHAGRRHAGLAVHRGAAGGQPPPHRQDPADRRLRHAAERARTTCSTGTSTRTARWSRGPSCSGRRPTRASTSPRATSQMAQAQSFATAAALTHLGYTVTSTERRRARSIGIAPARRRRTMLKVAQVITAVNGTPTPTRLRAGRRPARAAPGRPGHAQRRAVLHQRRRGVRARADRAPRRSRSATPPKGLVDTGCGAPTKPTAYLGIEPETQQDWHFPVKVTVHTQDIGGPSAGLAMTLGIIDKLSSGRLTGQPDRGGHGHDRPVRQRR